MDHWGLRAGLACIAFALASACAGLPPPALAQTVSSGAFRDLASIETSLVRGVTSKADVRRQLGIPNGSGAARFASLGGDEREIWYYEDIEMTGAKALNKTLKVDLRQQILLVIFNGEMVDGYLWTSNSGTALAR